MSDGGVAARRCSSGNNSSERLLLVIFFGNNRNQYQDDVGSSVSAITLNPLFPIDQTNSFLGGHPLISHISDNLPASILEFCNLQHKICVAPPKLNSISFSDLPQHFCNSETPVPVRRQCPVDLEVSFDLSQPLGSLPLIPLFCNS
ncbi:hypothetical protein MRB53_021074 [Persea americana]|uniref:Uncharacterized protein n=1 Tax=Persea americana TaxID=3435 RepID=A0ACC2L3V9_PERAE|nr:hypothetical protein MRB53_021074 [Persea americana]